MLKDPPMCKEKCVGNNAQRKKAYQDKNPLPSPPFSILEMAAASRPEKHQQAVMCLVSSTYHLQCP